MTKLKYDFENSIGYWIIITAHALERSLSQELAPHGITNRQWQVLAWLALEGELCQTELAERMKIEPPTLVRVLDRMEQAGWIRRRDDPADRRKKLITATDEAVPTWTRATTCARQVRERAVNGIEPEEMERLMQAMRSIQQNLSRPVKAKKDQANVVCQ